MAQNFVWITKDDMVARVIESTFDQVWEPRGWSIAAEPAPAGWFQRFYRLDYVGLPSEGDSVVYRSGKWVPEPPAGASPFVVVTTKTRAAIAAALGSLSTTGGHVYVPGGVYGGDVPLVIWSNTTLELAPDAVIDLPVNSANRLIENAAWWTTGRNIADVTLVSGSKAVVINAVLDTSGNPLPNNNAYFQPSDSGKTVTVRNLADPTKDYTTTLTYTDSKHGQLGIAPTWSGVTVISVGPRDKNIRITGGDWRGGDTSNANRDNSTLGLCVYRCDGVDIRDLTVEQGTNRNFAISFGDVTDYHVEGIDFACSGAADGVDIQGPAYRGTVKRLRGDCWDDAVGVLGYNWNIMRNTFGPITGLVIEDVDVRSRTQEVGLWSSPNAKIDDVTLRNVRANSRTEGLGALAAFNSMNEQGCTNNIGSITFEDCSGRVAFDGAAHGGTYGTIRWVRHRIDPWMVVAYQRAVQWWGPGTTDAAIFENPSGSTSTQESHLVEITDGHVVTRLQLNGSIFGTSGASAGLICLQAGGKASRIYLDEFDFTGAGWVVLEYLAGDGGADIWLRDGYANCLGFGYLQSPGKVFLSNVRSTAAGFTVTGANARTFYGRSFDTVTGNALNAQSSFVDGPWRSGVSFDESPLSVVAGAWAVGQKDASFRNFQAYNGSNAQNDGAIWPVDLSPGTWKLDFIAVQNPAYAIVTLDISFDRGTTWTAIGTVDLYTAGADAGIRTTFSGIAVPKFGQAWLRLRALTRNAAQTSNWYVGVSAAEFTRTA